jgi:hypothetical protein
MWTISIPLRTLPKTTWELHLGLVCRYLRVDTPLTCLPSNQLVTAVQMNWGEQDSDVSDSYKAWDIQIESL